MLRCPCMTKSKEQCRKLILPGSTTCYLHRKEVFGCTPVANAVLCKKSSKGDPFSWKQIIQDIHSIFFSQKPAVIPGTTKEDTSHFINLKHNALHFDKRPESDLLNEMKEVVVYYPSSASTEDVQSLLYRRKLYFNSTPASAELLNMATDVGFSYIKLKSCFGVAHPNYYSVYFSRHNNQSLAPNITVYMQPEVLCTDDKLRRRHVAYMIPYVFENSMSEDMNYFFGDKRDSNDAMKELSFCYEQMLWRVYFTAINIKSKEVVLQVPLIASFTQALSSDQLNTCTTAIRNALQKILPFSQEYFSITTQFYFPSNTASSTIVQLALKNIPFTTTYDFATQMLEPQLYEKTLFCVVGNPYSLFGIDVMQEDTMDGFMGQHSNVTSLGSSLMNPFITQSLVSVPNMYFH